MPSTNIKIDLPMLKPSTLQEASNLATGCPSSMASLKFTKTQ